MNNKILYILSLLGILYGILVISMITCSSDKNIMTPDPDPVPVDSINDTEKAALNQLLKMEYPDLIVSSNINGNMVEDISTASWAFRYGGLVTITVAAVKAIIVWHQTDEERNYVGTSYGFISRSRDIQDPVTILKPGNVYYFWTNWDNDPFLAANAFYTNVFVVKDGSFNKENINNFIGKSLKEVL